MKLKVLNLFAGIGGNRHLWDVFDVEVTAIELNQDIAAEYKKLYPQDDVKIQDAYEYLENYYQEFDIIWASPPCQTHTQLSRTNPRGKKKIPDMRLYGIIIFLKYNFAGNWVVENVRPYYGTLLPAVKLGRHYFWSNVKIPGGIKAPKYSRSYTFSRQQKGEGTQAYLDSLEIWLGFKISRRLYLNENHDPAQVYRNCVHPYIGKYVFKTLLGKPKPTQAKLEAIIEV